MITLNKISEYLKAKSDVDDINTALKKLPHYQELCAKLRKAKATVKDMGKTIVDDNSRSQDVRRLLTIDIKNIEVPGYDYDRLDISPNTEKLLAEPVSAVVSEIIRVACKGDPNLLRQQFRSERLKKAVNI